MSDDAVPWELEPLASAERLRAWMFSTVRPTAAGPGADVGAGIGTFSRLLLDAGIAPLTVVEPEPACVDALRDAFADDSRVTVAAESVPGSAALAALEGTLAYVLCQNVLEHIDDDAAALRELLAALRDDGEAVVLVPAHPRLFNRLDAKFGHHRRYTRERLDTVVRDAGGELVSLRSFNLLGIAGWWVAGRTRTEIDSRSLAVYELLVRFWRPVEERIRPNVGLSLVARVRRAR